MAAKPLLRSARLNASSCWLPAFSFGYLWVRVCLSSLPRASPIGFLPRTCHRSLVLRLLPISLESWWLWACSSIRSQAQVSYLAEPPRPGRFIACLLPWCRERVLYFEAHPLVLLRCVGLGG